MSRVKQRRLYLLRDFKFRTSYISILVGQLTRCGKKNKAIKYLTIALFFIKQRTGLNPLLILQQAINNIKPLVELKKKTVAGKVYHIPAPLRKYRDFKLGVRWLLEAAKKQHGKNLGECLGREIMDASSYQGSAVTKKMEYYNIVIANRPFIFFK